MTLATSPRPCLYPCSLRGRLCAPKYTNPRPAWDLSSAGPLQVWGTLFKGGSSQDPDCPPAPPALRWPSRWALPLPGAVWPQSLGAAPSHVPQAWLPGIPGRGRL